MQTDEIDRRIIELLNQDGRIGHNAIAARLDISEGTVRNRLAKLTADGRLRVTGQVNPDAAPAKQLMLLGIRIACSKDLAKKAAEIAHLEDVLSASITAGRYDIIAEVWVDAKGGLISFLGQKLARIDGIASTESFLVMKSINKWISRADL